MTTLFGYPVTLTIELEGGPLNVTHAIDLMAATGLNVPIRGDVVIRAIDDHLTRCPLCGAVATASGRQQ